LRAAVRLTFAVTVPARSAPDERRGERVSSDAAAPVRGRGRVRLRVHVTCTLDAGASHLGLAVETRGAASDHRLRLEMASGVSAPSITADAAMWPVLREPTTASSAMEAVVPSAPLHRWVAAHSSHAGVVLVSDGLAEYEALGSGRLAVTLQRATGELSRATLAERPGHAGWPSRTPGAQGPRRSRARFAVAPIGTFSAGWANTLAEDVLLPLVGHTWRDAPAAAPATVSGLTLEAATEVVALAVKPADDGLGLIARCVNWSDAPQAAVWRAPWPDVRATHVRLDETSARETKRVPLDVNTSASDTRCAILLPPRAIVTLRLTRGGDPRARPR
jgi:alpha-mannosidase